MTVLSVLCLCFFAYSQGFILDGKKFPFQDTNLSWEKRVDDLVNRLTLQEHTEQMAIGSGSTPDIKRLGIGHYSWWSNCGRGAVGNEATSFPCGVAQAAAWDSDLLFRVARASAIETRAWNNIWTSQNKYGTHKGLSCFSPNMDIHRDPRWGRNPETWGEDPYFGGVYAERFVKGIQGDDPKYLLTSASCKHYTTSGGPENIPVSRMGFNANVTERDLRTTFLPGYKKCVDAGSYSVLCAYNRVNGVPACADKYLLTDILRKEWKFKGYVVADCGAMENMVKKHHYFKNYEEVAAAGLKSGMNLNCQTSKDNAYLSIADAVNHGKVSMDLVKDMAKPLWMTRMRLGEFDPPEHNKYRKISHSSIQTQAHRDLAVEAAMKSYVLLKNKDHFLPLNKKHKYNTIAIVGPQGDNINDQSGGYSPRVMAKYATSIKDGLAQLGHTTHTVNGCKDGTPCTKYDSHAILNAVQHAEIVFVALGLEYLKMPSRHFNIQTRIILDTHGFEGSYFDGNKLEHESKDRADIKLPGHQLTILQDAIKHSPHNAKVVLLMMSTAPFDIEEFDRNDKVAAIIELFYPAQATGTALHRLIVHQNPGDVFSGKLPFTWMTELKKVPPMVDYSMKERTYRYITYQPLYPFGYGLSYTTFHYFHLSMDTDVQAGHDVKGFFVLENTGPLDADEISQVYIKWVKPRVETPRIQLVDFSRRHFPKHTRQTIHFTIKAENMAVWVDNSGWEIDPGTIEVFVGGQQPGQHKSISSNILHGSFKITGSKKLGKY
ncbi:hypothetical protein LOTGIDRAFT_236077, partial [Lottia gigantea]